MKNSAGNILFLILICVALFGALSFAVTQATRGTSQNNEKQVAAVDSATLFQYTLALRQAIMQMMQIGAVKIADVEFNPPSDSVNLTSPSVGVFNPSGGGITYVMAAHAAMDTTAGNTAGQWIFTYNFEIAGVGTSQAASFDGNDLVAFLPGIKANLCEQINLKAGIPTYPFPDPAAAVPSASDMLTNINDYYVDNDYVQPVTEYVLGAGAGDADLFGRDEGCYLDSASNSYVYYGVIAER